MDGSFAMGTETYVAQVLIDSLVVNHYVALSDTALFTGDVAVQGTGLDFFMPSTKLQATANLRNSRFGQVNLDKLLNTNMVRPNIPRGRTVEIAVGTEPDGRANSILWVLVGQGVGGLGRESRRFVGEE